MFNQSNAPNPLLALLVDDDDDAVDVDGNDEISAFGRAGVLNLDDTRVELIFVKFSIKFLIIYFLFVFFSGMESRFALDDEQQNGQCSVGGLGRRSASISNVATQSSRAHVNNNKYQCNARQACACACACRCATERTSFFKRSEFFKKVEFAGVAQSERIAG